MALLTKKIGQNATCSDEDTLYSKVYFSRPGTPFSFGRNVYETNAVRFVEKKKMNSKAGMKGPNCGDNRSECGEIILSSRRPVNCRYSAVLPAENSEDLISVRPDLGAQGNSSQSVKPSLPVGDTLFISPSVLIVILISLNSPNMESLSNITRKQSSFRLGGCYRYPRVSRSLVFTLATSVLQRTHTCTTPSTFFFSSSAA